MAIFSDYDLNSKVRVSKVYLDADGLAVDPSVVSVSTWSPGTASVNAYVYPTDAELVKDSTGHYHIDVLGDEVGIWRVQWVGDGFLESFGFNIQPTVFA